MYRRLLPLTLRFWLDNEFRWLLLDVLRKNVGSVLFKHTPAFSIESNVHNDEGLSLENNAIKVSIPRSSLPNVV